MLCHISLNGILEFEQADALFNLSESQLRDSSGNISYTRKIANMVITISAPSFYDIRKNRTTDYVEPVKVTIKGSLQKLFAGQNVTNITLEETLKSIEKVASFLNLPFEEIVVTRLETSINLHLPNGLSTRPALESLRQFKSKEMFWTGAGNSSGVGMHKRSDNCKEKFLRLYDKSLESKVDGNILRVELVGNASRILGVKQQVTLADLYDELTLGRLARQLISSLAELIFDEDILLYEKDYPDKAFCFKSKNHYLIKNKKCSNHLCRKVKDGARDYLHILGDKVFLKSGDSLTRELTTQAADEFRRLGFPISS